MKVPISKQLADSLLIPLVAITLVALLDIYTSGQKRFFLNSLIILIWGFPIVFILGLLFNKKTKFKQIIKVRKSERLFIIPISSNDVYVYFIISSLLMFGGLGSMLNNNNFLFGLILFMTGLIIFLFFAISLEHSKIWFNDSYNAEDDQENYANTPKESIIAYQDGIFTYNENSFTIQLESEEKTILWGEIVSINAYKVDHLLNDCIVIEIGIGESIITINEQTVGYLKFMEQAKSKLLNFEKNWLMKVAYPPFETIFTEIYNRQTEKE